MSLRHYTWRAMQQRPGRTILTMLSIVIGVTAAVAVGLGTATTRNAYKQMFAIVTGRTTLEIDAQGGGGFDKTILGKVQALSGIAVAAPLIDRPGSMSIEGGERRVRLEVLGVDPEVDQKVRDYAISAGRQVQSGKDEIALDEQFAKFLGLKVGDEVRLLTQHLSTRFEIVGLVQPKTGALMTQTAMALIPLDRAQYHLNPRGRTNLIDRIQIVTAPNVDPDKFEPQVAAILPEGLAVHRPAASTQLMRETLLSTEQGLTLTTLFSLLMAAFIILNTFLMNVSERRRQLSIMRAIGATKLQVGGMLLREAALLGVVGTALGIGLGVLLAFVGTNLVGRAFDVQLPPLRDVMTPQPFITGIVFGLIMALVGAVVPALLAAQVSPLEGMNRVANIKKWDFTRLFLVAGLILTVGSLVEIYGSIEGRLPIDAATYSAVALLVGLVLLDTTILSPQASLVARLLKLLSPVEAGMALRQVLRNHMRSALTVAVLFIAGSTGVGMASSILDCVQDVHNWFNQAIVGDYFLRAMMPDMATGTSADLPEEVGAELHKTLAQAPGSKIDDVAFVEAQVPRGEEESNALRVIVIARQYENTGDSKPPAFDLIAGDPARLRQELQSGQVVIGSVLAQKLSLKLGDKLPLESKQGVQQLTICGVANEYMVGGLAVHMARKYAEEWLGVTGVDGYIINVPPAYREAIKPALEALAKKYDVILMSQADIRNTVNQFVKGTEWSLWLLVFMGFVVGAFGVVNTLTMNVLEQTRELGLLRIVAMTRGQVRRTILMQALIIGGVGLPPGILLGVAVAYVMNLAMMPSFGHPIAFHVHPDMLLATFVGAIIIVLFAAIIPARRATRINVVEALHYE
jgi:putative ABC transport system permease protein